MLTSFLSFPNTINTFKQSLTLTNTLLETLKLNTLDGYGDFEHL